MTAAERWQAAVELQRTAADAIDAMDGSHPLLDVSSRMNEAVEAMCEAWPGAPDRSTGAWSAAYRVVREAIQRWNIRCRRWNTDQSIEATRLGMVAALERVTELVLSTRDPAIADLRRRLALPPAH